jgi:hypothetical protein
MIKLRKEFYKVRIDPNEAKITVPAPLIREFKLTSKKSKVRWSNRNGKLIATIE